MLCWSSYPSWSVSILLSKIGGASRLLLEWCGQCLCIVSHRTLCISRGIFLGWKWKFHLVLSMLVWESFDLAQCLLFSVVFCCSFYSQGVAFSQIFSHFLSDGLQSMMYIFLIPGIKIFVCHFSFLLQQLCDPWLQFPFFSRYFLLPLVRNLIILVRLWAISSTSS